MKAGYMVAIVTCPATAKDRALQTGERPYMVRSQIIICNILFLFIF